MELRIDKKQRIKTLKEKNIHNNKIKIQKMNKNMIQNENKRVKV